MFTRLHRRVGRIPDQRLWRTAYLLVGAIIAIGIAATMLPGLTIPLAGKPVPFLGWYLVYVFPPIRLLEFVLGIVLARIVMTGRWRAVRASHALLLLAACYTASLFVSPLLGMCAFTVIPIALLIPALANMDLSNRRTFLSGRTMVRLGELSFALYMVHYIFIYATRQHTIVEAVLAGEPVPYGSLSVPAGIGVILLWLAAAMVAAWLLYVLVERPAMRRWGSTWARARPAEPATREAPPVRSAAPAPRPGESPGGETPSSPVATDAAT
jgi:peptidoglycan/LPS O-acetylase OafA/YrhL